MTDDANYGFTFTLSNLDEATSTICGLVAALHIAMEYAVFPESVKVEKVAPAGFRLDSINREIIRAVKGFYNADTSIVDEASGLTLALRFIEDNAAAIRRTHKI